MTYSFPHFYSATAEVWKWLSNSSHTLLDVWFLLHAGIRFNPYESKGPLVYQIVQTFTPNIAF